MDEFTFVLFLLTATKEMRDGKELAAFTKGSQTPSWMEKHWKVTQREHKRKGTVTISAAKVLGGFRIQSKKM